MDQTEIVNTIVGSLLEERALVDDPRWDSVAVLATVTPHYADLTAYRYTGAEAGTATPLTGTEHQLFRDLQEATKGPDDKTWEVCIVKIERDTARGSVNFVYSDEASIWQIDPADPARLAENLRPRSEDFN
jgi:hypothetical protein